MKNFPAFVSGILIGIVTGVTVTPLIFPDYGRRLKREIADYMDELLEDARRAAEDRMAELEAEFEELTGHPQHA